MSASRSDSTPATPRRLYLLAAASTVALAAAIAIPAWRDAQHSEEYRWVKRDMARISNAIASYTRANQRLPIPPDALGSGEGVDEYVAHNEEELLKIYRILAGQQPPGKDFLLMEPARFLRDPWDSDYLLKFDSNGNGLIEYWTGGEERLAARFIIVSAGPDRQRGNPQECDDIVVLFPKRNLWSATSE